jgi:D-alanyl-D-alanine carboxypeptidase
MSKRMLRAGLAGIAVMALLAAACGSDDDTAQDDGAENEGAEADEVDEVDDVEVEEIEVDEAALQAILDEWRTDWETYGATLSIRIPDHGDIHLASGIDDRDPDTPMPTDGTYAIGSITKTFVAAIVLQLVNEGRLSLDEPVEAWVPELPNAEEITVAMLLGHTAGLGDWYGPRPDASEITPQEVLAKHLEQPPVGQPGEGFAYANAGYIALGLLIERELDQDLAAVIEDRFTAPLSLSDTLLSDGSTKPTRHGWFSPDNDPLGWFSPNDDPDRPIDLLDFLHEGFMTRVWAAGAMISSSEDMLDWGEALYSGDLLGADTTAAMLEMRPAFSPSEHYGLGAMGWCLDPNDCAPQEVELVGHGGAISGYKGLLGYHPESGLTLVVHANVYVGTVGSRSAPLMPLLADVLHELGLVDEAAEHSDDPDTAAA